MRSCHFISIRLVVELRYELLNKKKKNTLQHVIFKTLQCELFLFRVSAVHQSQLFLVPTASPELMSTNKSQQGNWGKRKNHDRVQAALFKQVFRCTCQKHTHLQAAAKCEHMLRKNMHVLKFSEVSWAALHKSRKLAK